ncbi:MAG: glycosyltransferase [bacterium]|nr:glycosyltransferase [bacterium]
MSQPVFSIVIPAYNEAANLPTLLARYVEVWEDLPAELVIVNNGSADDTSEVLERELAREELHFARAVTIENNRGYGHGIHTGLLTTTGEIVGFSHADMQTDPADLFRAYHELRAAPDPRQLIVKGQRAPRDFAAELLTAGMSFAASVVLMRKLTDVNAQPKVFHRDHLARLTDPPDGIPYDLYVLFRGLRAGLRIVTIPVQFGERAHGESRWAANIFSRYRTILGMIGFVFRLRFRGG